MKKLMLVLLSLVMIFVFCACANKTEEEKENYNEEGIIENNDEMIEETSGEYYEEVEDISVIMERYIARTYDDTVIKLHKDSERDIDINYAKEYYRVLLPFKDNYEVEGATISNGKDFPALVIKSGDDVFAYQYEDNIAEEISLDGINIDDISFSDIYACTNIFENAVITQGDLYERVKNLKDNKTSFEDIMNEYLATDDIIYGSAYYAEESEDGTQIEKSSAVSLSGDGKLYMEVSDSSTNMNKTISITGIDDTIVYGEMILDNEEDASNPDKIYFLTVKGDVYVAKVKDATNTVNATKIESLNRIISLEYIMPYPNVTNQTGELDTELYALSYDGNLYILAE